MKFTLDRLVRVPILMLALVALVLTGVPASAQDEPQVTWRQYDVTVEVRDDGSLRVTEAIETEFNDSFSKGKRTIPMDRIESISDVEVSVGSTSSDLTTGSQVNQTVLLDPGEFNGRQVGDEFVIDYGFERTSFDSSDSVRAVVISYTANGVIRDYPDASPPEQQVRWTGVSSEVTQTGPVDSASVTVIFPEPIAEDELAIDPAPTFIESDRIVWEREGLDSGDSLQVAVAFPPVTDATAPAWQAEADRYEGRREHVPAISALLGLVALVSWVVAILLMIVRGVKDPEVGLVADIIPHRPDDLPAPLVGTLVDESVETKDVLAGLLDLERQGMIRIREDETKSKKSRYRIDLLRPVAEGNEWDRPMLEGLFHKNAKSETDGNLRNRMKKLGETSMSAIRKAYEQELFRRGYFVEEPGKTRMRWVRNLLLLALVFVVAVGLVAWWTMAFSGWLVFPLVVAAIGLIVGLVLTTKAAVKSTEGAIVAATWRAYGRYVQQLKKGPEPRKFLQTIEADLPWAVALGFDQSWTKLADEMSSRPASDWDAGRRGSPVFVGGFGGDRSHTSTSSSDGGGDFGGLQGASARTLGAIGGGSAGMFAMLNDAAASFTEGSAPSGSSGGGGGFSGSASVGSSGGGGHSFS